MKQQVMKKVLSTVLVLVMLFGVTACGKSNADSTSADAGTGGSGGVDIGIVLPTKDEDRWVADEAKFRELIEEKGYKADIMYSQASSAIEKTNVETLIAKGIKVLLICPYDAAASASAVEMAKEEGIHVISYDRLITDTDAVDYYVAFESTKIGEAMGRYLVEQAEPYGGTGLN